MSGPVQLDFKSLLETGRRARREGDRVAALAAFETAIAVNPGDIGARVEAASELRELGRLDAAEDMLRQAIEINPKHIGALIGLGRVLRQRGDRAKSLPAFQAAAEADSHHIGARMEVGYDLRELGRFEEAEAAFRNVLALEPGHMGALLALGGLSRKRGDRVASLAIFEKASAVDPTHLGAKMEIAYDLRELGRLQDAEAMFRSVLKQKPDHVPALLGRVHLLRKQGDRIASLGVFAAAAIADPRHITARMEIAFDLRELGRLEEVEALFRLVLRDEPEHVGALVGLGRVLRQRNDRAGALAAFESAIKAEPDHFGAKIEAAGVLRELGRFDEADSMYRRILEKAEHNVSVMLALGNLMIDRYRLDDAERMFKKVLEINDNNVQALMALGHLARRRRDRHASLGYYEQAAAIDPAHIGARLEIAAELRDRGQYADAHCIVDAVMEANPNNLQAWMQRGQIYRREGNRRAAREAFAEASKSHPNHIQALVDMAVEHLALGEPNEAQQLLQRALDQDPTHLGALMQSAENAWLAEDSERCLALCLQAITAHPQSMRPYLTASRAAADLGRRDEAAELLTRAIAKFGMNAEIAAKQIELHRQARDWEAARNVLRGSADEVKRSFPLWAQSVQLAMNTGDFATVEQLLQHPPTTSTAEAAQANVYRGQYAEARWRFDEAVEHYRTALALNPHHTWIHSEMARACLLLLDLESAAHHLRISADLKVSRNLLRGWSLNISQNSLGQIFDEFALDREVITELRAARALPLDRQLSPLKDIVRKYPDNTAAALILIIALRQSGRLNERPAAPDPTTNASIPKRIGQFWDAEIPPPDIKELTSSWSAAHPDFEYQLFNDATARAFLELHCGRDVLYAFLRARHPAQRADIFRLAYLTTRGGIYVDADDRCIRPIATFIPVWRKLVLYQENYGTIGNNFIGAVPGHPMLAHALQLGVSAINRGDNDILWLCTGPGLLTRAFAQFVSGVIPNTAAWQHEFSVMEVGQLQRLIGVHCRVNYKKTEKHWSHASFRRSSKSEALASSADARAITSDVDNDEDAQQ